jgi:ATP-binding protein involved in chromosome partitioning
MSKENSNTPDQPGLAGVKNIIAVASGKGGVGKSTVSVNLAIALKEAGFKVGLMDADIYGPSQPGMLGSNEKPGVGDNYLEPVSRYGIDFISMGSLMTDDAPVIWRAPMATQVIQQFIGSVKWGELDYLLVDLPPGTGDVQITLAQKASLTGAIIVTTPQAVALDVAKKGLKMFEQVKVPILGIVENMSGFICKHCEKETKIFSSGGGQMLANEMNVPYLGSIPLDPEIMISGECGVPVIEKSAESAAAKCYFILADQLRESLEKLTGRTAADEPESIELATPQSLVVRWPGDKLDTFNAYDLRINCSCAACVDEVSGKRTLDPNSVPLEISIKSMEKVGNYGVSLDFSDGHNTGIYTFKHLFRLSKANEVPKGFSV